MLKQLKKLTLDGELAKVTNTHELGIDLLTEVRRRKAELDFIENEKRLKWKQQQFEIINEYVKLIREKVDEKMNYLGNHYWDKSFEERNRFCNTKQEKGSC